MKLRFKSKYGIPEGVYDAKFVGAKENTHDEYGSGIEWTFEVLSGPEKGKLASRTTAPQPTRKNSCGKILRGLSGNALLNEGQEIDLAELVGRQVQIVVGLNSTGNSTRVESVMPLGSPEFAGTAATGDEAGSDGKDIPF